jgi:N6-adenosine-specific RNA methylase IME4
LLITVDAALHALASVNTPDELITLANQAAALQVYARRAKLGMVVQNRCAEIRLRAERKLGELLTTTPRLHGRPKSVPDENTFPSLSELGVTDRKISHRAQRIAAVPARDFEAYFRDAQHQAWEITTRGLLCQSERRQASSRNRQRIVGGRIADLIEFAHTGPKMGCIVIDPPWPIEGSVLPYMDAQLDELKSLPVGELAAERCHLHLWTLPNFYHRTAYDLVEHWGFRVVSEFVWCKTQVGRGNYWRMSHEILPTAVQGQEDRFDDRSLRSWVEAPRSRHSEKPDVIREMIERASPGPRLELFARKLVPGWYAWGHEIAEPLTEQAASFHQPGTNDHFSTKRPLARGSTRSRRRKSTSSRLNSTAGSNQPQGTEPSSICYPS